MTPGQRNTDRARILNHDSTSAFWDMLALLLWAVVFAAGLVPDLAFQSLRALAQVSPYSALVNSSYAITLALSGYLAIFVLQRCRDAGATEPQARSKAVVAGCLGLLAFLELPNRGTSPFEPHTFLEIWINAGLITDTYARYVILVVGAAKLLAWWYLFALLLRYYAFGNTRVFRTLPTLSPSARPKHQPTPKTNLTDDPTAATSKATD